MSDIDTYTWHNIRTSIIGEDRIFPIGQKKNGMIRFKFENATYTIFNQPKSSVASSSSWRQMVTRRTDLSQPQVREYAWRSQKKLSKIAKFQRVWAPKELFEGIRVTNMLKVSFTKWEISSLHYKRGFSGPGHLGSL